FFRAGIPLVARSSRAIQPTYSVPQPPTDAPSPLSPHLLPLHRPVHSPPAAHGSEWSDPPRVPFRRAVSAGLEFLLRTPACSILAAERKTRGKCPSSQ